MSSEDKTIKQNYTLIQLNKKNYIYDEYKEI